MATRRGLLGHPRGLRRRAAGGRGAGRDQRGRSTRPGCSAPSTCSTARSCAPASPPRWSSGRCTGRRSTLLFDLWWPPAVGDRARPTRAPRRRAGRRAGRAGRARPGRAAGRAAAAAAGRATTRRCAGSPAGPSRGSGAAEPQPGRQSWFTYRVLRALSPDTLIASLLDALLAGEPRGGLAEQVARQTVRERIARPAGVRRGRGAPPGRRGARPRPGRADRAAGRWPTRSTSCGRSGRTWPRCAGPCTRWPAGWRPGWPPAAGSGGRAGSTSAGRCGPRSAPAACRSSPTTARAGRTSPSWSCSATSAARWPASRTSR